MANGKNREKDGTLRIQGADGKTVEIPAGRWYQNPKARPERLMINGALTGEARQVLDCLELHSIAYNQEECVFQYRERGQTRRRPLTPADVHKETKLPKTSVRRAHAELERAGIIKREVQDDGGRRIVVFAEPRQLEPSSQDDGDQTKEQRSFWPDWFPSGCESLKPYVTQQRINLLPNIDGKFQGDARVYLIAEMQEAARVYFEALEGVARVLEKVRARPISSRIKEVDRPDRLRDKSSSSSPYPSEAPTQRDDDEDFSSLTKNEPEGQQEPAAPNPPSDPEPSPAEPTQGAGRSRKGPLTFEELRDGYPKNRTDDAKARKQWKTLSAAERQKALDALPAFLQCERWTRTPQYIPFLSNWLGNAEYRHDPPPYFEARGPKSDNDIWGRSHEESDRIVREALEAERARKRQGGKP